MNQFKFQEVNEYLLLYIAKNKSTSNKKIPSERKIASLLNVSRTTVRYSMDKFIKERVLYREHGKGTFIQVDDKASKIHIAKDKPDAFNLNAISKGLEPNSTIISFKVIYDYEELSHIFPKAVNEYYELIRVRSINKQFCSIEKCYFPFRIFPDANRYDFSKLSLYEYMDHKGMKPTIFNKTIDVVHSNYYNEILGLNKNDPLFLDTYIGKNGDTIVEYTETYMNPQYVEYSFNF